MLVGAIDVTAWRVVGRLFFHFQDFLAMPAVSMFGDGSVVQAGVQEGCHRPVAQLYRVIRANVIRSEKEDKVRAIYG